MPDTIRILYLEDDPRDSDLVKARLEEREGPRAPEHRAVELAMATRLGEVLSDNEKTRTLIERLVEALRAEIDLYKQVTVHNMPQYGVVAARLQPLLANAEAYLKGGAE